jgi:hypothetical protein
MGIKHSFYCTLTNLTVLGIEKFVKFIGNRPAQYTLCTDPAFLSVNMIDPESKQQVLDSLDRLPAALQTVLGQDLQQPADEKQRHELQVYLQEFAVRRNIDLNFLPETFVKWLT